MKRLLPVLMALTIMIGFSGIALAAQPAKVDVCHNPKDTGETVYSASLDQDIPVYEGTEINVNENAVNAHEGHGDATLAVIDTDTGEAVDTGNLKSNCNGLAFVDGELVTLVER